MFANPIIRRYRFSQLRPQQVWVFGAMYVCVVLLILFINSSIYRYGDGAYKTLTDLYKGLFVQFAILELFLLWLLCPANCSNVVSREIADKSFDFFRMLPVSASKKAAGIVIGRNLFCLLAAAVNLVLCIAFGLMGGISSGLIVQMATLLLVLTAALNLLGLMFSVLSYRKTKAHSSIPLLLVVGLFGFGPVTGMMFEVVKNQEVETAAAFLYTFEMPVLYLVSFCALCIAVWAYIGVLRRFTYEYEALFSRAGGPLFTLFFIVLLLGLVFRVLYPGPETERWCGTGVPDVKFFWLFSLVPVWVVPLFSLRSFDTYLEISRGARRAEGLVGRLLAGSNMVGGLILFAIWLAFAVPVGITAGADMAEFLWAAMMAGSSFLVVLSLLEMYAMWKPINEKIGYLLGFMAIMYFGLPPVLGAVLGVDEFYLFGPFGAIHLFDEYYPVPTLLLPIFFNLFCLLPLGVLIGKRYSDLVFIRTQISQQSAFVRE